MSACTTSYEELITVRVIVPTWEHVSPSAEHVPVCRASFPILWVLVSRAWPHSQSCISFQSSSFARKPVPVCRTQAICRTRAVCRTQPCFKSLPVSGASVHDHRARVPASCFQQTLPSLKKLPLLTEPVCVQSLCGLNPHKTSPYLQSLSLGAVSAGPASFPRAWVSLSWS